MVGVNEDLGLVGSVVAERYLVEDVLGEGSTGTVFGTSHVHLGRRAAMKLLRPPHATVEAVQHVFHDETRHALAVTHPSLCEVFDVGALPDGTPFLVMERLEGETLGARLRHEPLSAAAAVDMMMQLLSAMDALHTREVVLRDLRPQNVFLAHRRGCRPLVKLLDLGLSRLLPLERVQAEWTALGAEAAACVASGHAPAALAIPFYLSPEQARGEHAVDTSSDIFVAGIILYEALTGVKPFAATSWEGVVQQICLAQPTPIEELRPDLSAALGALVMRALSAYPRARPASARAMQDELRKVLEGPAPLSGAARAPRADRAVDRALASTAETSAAVDSLYDDDTRTDRKNIDLKTASRDAGSIVDEASAEHPQRTLRPPRGSGLDLDIEIHFEPEASAPATEEDETETRDLTPETRARIDALVARAGEDTDEAIAPDGARPGARRARAKPRRSR